MRHGRLGYIIMFVCTVLVLGRDIAKSWTIHREWKGSLLLKQNRNRWSVGNAVRVEVVDDVIPSRTSRTRFSSANSRLVVTHSAPKWELKREGNTEWKMAAGVSAAEGEEDGKNRKRLFHGPHKPGRVLLAYIYQRSLSLITLYEFSCNLGDNARVYFTS